MNWRLHFHMNFIALFRSLRQPNLYLYSYYTVLPSLQCYPLKLWTENNFSNRYLWVSLENEKLRSIGYTYCCTFLQVFQNTFVKIFNQIVEEMRSIMLIICVFENRSFLLWPSNPFHLAGVHLQPNWMVKDSIWV